MNRCELIDLHRAVAPAPFPLADALGWACLLLMGLLLLALIVPGCAHAVPQYPR